MRPPRGSVLGALTQIVGGRLSVQLLMLMSAPILARLFTPAEFGEIALLTMGLAIIKPVMMCSYDDAIVVARDNTEAGALAVLCGLLLLVTTAVFSAIAIACAPWVATRFDAPNLTVLLPMAPLFAAFQAISTALSHWAAFRGRFAPVAVAMPLAAFVRGGLPIALALLLGGSSLTLVSGLAVAPLCFAAVLIWVFAGDLRRWAAAGRTQWRAAAARHRSFLYFQTPADLLTMASIFAPAAILGMSFNTHAVGLYSKAFGLLNLPFQLLMDAVSRTLYPTLANGHESGQLGASVEQIASLLPALAVGPLMGALVAGPELFALVLGEPFRVAGEYARPLSLAVLGGALFHPLRVTYAVLGHQRVLLRQTATLAPLVLGSLAIGGLSGSVHQALTAFAITSFCVNAYQLSWVMRAAGARLSVALAALLRWGAMAGVLVGGAGLLPPGWNRLAATSLGVCLYLCLAARAVLRSPMLGSQAGRAV